MEGRLAVYLEVAARRTFAVAIDWPGWARSGRDEQAALSALAAYAPRYAAAVGQGHGVPRVAVDDLEVTERLAGGPTTEFGAPGAIPAADEQPLEGDELRRQIALLESAWRAFDATAAGAVGVELRRGPRGGGRDLDPMIEHVIEAERSYLVRLGGKHRRRPGGSLAHAWLELRHTMLDTLRARARDRAVPSPSAAHDLWPVRYFVRRAAWHVLDHAWEIEDRSAPQQRAGV